MERTYYRGPDAVVTDKAVVWFSEGQPQQVKLTELRVRDITITTFHRRPRWHLWAAVIAVLTATAILAWLFADTSEWIAGGLLAAGVLAAGVLGYAWRPPSRPRWWEVRAAVGGLRRPPRRHTDRALRQP